MAPDGPPARANPARGLALIATAVILGFFILRNGIDTDTDLAAEAQADDDSEEVAEDQPDEEASDGDDTEEDTPADGNEGDDSEGDDPAPELREPSEVTVRVANTTAVGGAAGTMTSQIENNGYGTTEATDAAERDRAETLIYFREGYEQEALALSNAIAPEGTAVQAQPVPADPPLERDNSEPLLNDNTHLLVLLGSDLADAG